MFESQSGCRMIARACSCCALQTGHKSPERGATFCRSSQTKNPRTFPVGWRRWCCAWCFGGIAGETIGTNFDTASERAGSCEGITSFNRT